jgi:twitching motility protein PilI
MAKQLSLREFQQGLAQRLREAQAEAEPTSRLGVRAGERNWLVKLDDAGEMLPLPEISSVPLTKPWYLGLANIRGVLASVVDFAAFMGGESTVRTPDCRLLLIADRFHASSGLVVSRMLGLRNVQTFKATTEADTRPWISTAYRDEDGNTWHELDVGQLVAHDEFLHVGA